MKASPVRKSQTIEPRVRTWPHPKVTRKGWFARFTCDHNFRCVLHDSEPPMYRVVVCVKCGEDKLVRGLPVITTPAPPMPTPGPKT